MSPTPGSPSGKLRLDGLKRHRTGVARRAGIALASEQRTSSLRSAEQYPLELLRCKSYRHADGGWWLLRVVRSGFPTAHQPTPVREGRLVGQIEGRKPSTQAPADTYGPYGLQRAGQKFSRRTLE